MVEGLRTVRRMECGSFLYDTCRICYITGCCLPDLSVATLPLTHFDIEPQVIHKGGRADLLLKIQMDTPSTKTYLPLYFNYSVHEDFLQDLAQASAVYLISGDPISATLENRPAFMKRLAGSGQGIAISENVRQAIQQTVELNSVPDRKPVQTDLYHFGVHRAQMDHQKGTFN